MLDHVLYTISPFTNSPFSICEADWEFPLELDSKFQKVAWIKSSTRIRLSQLHSMLTLAYNAVLVYHLCLGHLTLSKRLLGLPCLLTFTALTSCGWTVGPNIPPIQMINLILKYERNLVRGKFRDKYI